MYNKDGSWTTKYIMFRDLSADEVIEFQKYAQENDPEKLSNWGMYHPVCRDEWTKRGINPPNHGANI